MFYVKCEVWGGVTGSRTALLTSNGEVTEFEDRAAAQATAARLTKEKSGSHITASFRYSVVG